MSVMIRLKGKKRLFGEEIGPLYWLFKSLGSLVDCFAQERTASRAFEMILGLLTVPGRKTCEASRQYRNEDGSESADLKTFSRAEWDVRSWFSEVLRWVIQMIPPGQPLVIGMDDSALRKSGKGIPQAQYVYDALAIKWLKQKFAWGIRVLQLSALVPLEYAAGRCYSIPVGFYPKPAAKKPRGKCLSDEDLAAYQAAKKSTLLTAQATQEMKDLRDQLNRLGFSKTQMLVVVDGSYMNGSCAAERIPGIDMVGRIRGTAQLFRKAEVKVRNQYYGEQLPTPQDYLQDKSLHWKKAVLWWCGMPLEIKFKEVMDVYWKQGTRKRPMRLLVVQGQPYQPKNKRKRKQRNSNPRKHAFHKPGFLLATDLTSDPKCLLQAYLDRWQVESTFKDLKTGLGVAHPQISNFDAVERIPSAMTAMYSLWMLAVLKTHGSAWSPNVVPLRSHQRRKIEARMAKGKIYARRFSQQDFIRLLRNDLERLELFGAGCLPGVAPEGWVLSSRASFSA